MATPGRVTRPVPAEPSPELLRELAERVARPDFARFEAQLRSSGYCAHPIRLQGHVDVEDANGRRRVFSTDSEPDGVLRKACGNRRAAVCPPCAETYRWDAYQLLIAGLCGGKGVPASVAEHPLVFVTLTAPSFGPVHSLRLGPDGQPRSCRPRRDGPVCEHGVRLSCGELHTERDPCLGEPLCLDCYDHAGAVVWNNTVGELWRCTTIYLRRHVARHAGLTQAEAERRVTPAYARVGEFHKRGLVHVHALVRLDRAMPDYRRHELRAPDAVFTVDVLEQAVRSAVSEVHAKGSKYLGSPRVRWGDELDVRPLSDRGRPSREAAGYLAKYATKSTEQAGGLLHRVKASDVETVRVRPHVRAHLRAAFELHAQAEPHADATRRAHAAAATAEASRYPPAASGRYPNELASRARQAIARDERVRLRIRDERRDRRGRLTACTTAEPRNGIAVQVTLDTGERIHLADVALIAHATPRPRDRHDPRLAACAHQFGHRGHCLTKSRRYSTTLTALRQARHEHAARTSDHHSGSGAPGQLALADHGPTLRISSLHYAGQGHFTAADELLARSAANRAREHKRLAREEFGAVPTTTITRDRDGAADGGCADRGRGKVAA
jgi:Replication initiator protein, pSAM2